MNCVNWNSSKTLFATRAVCNVVNKHQCNNAKTKVKYMILKPKHQAKYLSGLARRMYWHILYEMINLNSVKSTNKQFAQLYENLCFVLIP